MPEDRDETSKGNAVATRPIGVLKGDEKNTILRGQLVIQFRKGVCDFHTLQARWNAKAKEQISELESIAARLERLG